MLGCDPVPDPYGGASLDLDKSSGSVEEGFLLTDWLWRSNCLRFLDSLFSSMYTSVQCFFANLLVSQGRNSFLIWTKASSNSLLDSISAGVVRTRKPCPAWFLAFSYSSNSWSLSRWGIMLAMFSIIEIEPLRIQSMSFSSIFSAVFRKEISTSLLAFEIVKFQIFQAVKDSSFLLRAAFSWRPPLLAGK